MHVLVAPNKQTNALHVFDLLQTVQNICFELFTLVGIEQTIGYHFLCLLSLVMFLCTGYVCSSSVTLVWSYKSYFLKNKVILSSFLGHKMALFIGMINY